MRVFNVFSLEGALVLVGLLRKTQYVAYFSNYEIKIQIRVK